MKLRVKLGELRGLLRDYRGVFVLVYDSRVQDVEYIERLLRAVSQAFEPSVPVVGVDVASEKHALEWFSIDERTPLLLFFVEGKRVWMQHGLFYDLRYDKLAIRLGIRNALERWGLKPVELGIRLYLLAM